MLEVSCNEILDNLFDALYFVDTDRKITYWNKAAEKLTGYKKKEIINKHCSDNILRHIDNNGKELCLEDCPIVKAMEKDKKTAANVFLHHKKGHRIPVNIRITPIKNKKGEITGAVEVFSKNADYCQMQSKIKKMKQDILQDELTHVGNRKDFEKHFMKSKEKKKDDESGLIYLDIDSFKNINDKYGHVVGDQIIKMVANTIAEAIRGTDSVYRWGGEEFVILLPNITKDMLKEIAERVRLLIDNGFIMVKKEKISPTVSIGASMISRKKNLDQMIKKVDNLMYKSKKSGRNFVTYK